MNPIEEKPQKADLRAKIKRLAYHKVYGDRVGGEEYISKEKVLALIDGDSKAREEEKKRLADDLTRFEQAIGVLIRQSEGNKATIRLDYLVGWDDLLLKHIAELNASKQDSEGTG